VTAVAPELLAALAGVSFVAAVRVSMTGGVAARLGAPRSAAGERIVRPGIVIRFLGRLGKTRVASRLSGHSRSMALERSGWRIDAGSFTGMRMVGAAAGLVVGIASPWPGLMLSPLWCLAGAHMPVFLAGRAASRRLASIDAEVPQLLDLLAAASSAGLSAPLALRRASEAVTGPLAGEIDFVLRAVDLGGRWRDELRAAADRLDLPDVRRAVAAMTRTETLGASLADSTGELAATVRQARRAAVTERARAAPVKMLFPLVFLVLPAFLLLTVVPVLLTTLQSIR
jgi:tight adherence protein C